jgi:hypothetical protein
MQKWHVICVLLAFAGGSGTRSLNWVMTPP